MLMVGGELREGIWRWKLTLVVDEMTDYIV